MITSDPACPVPEEERYAGLKDALKEFVRLMISVIEKQERFAFVHQNPFYFLLLGWLHDPQTPGDNEIFSQRRKQWLEVGYDGDRVKHVLEDILSNDKHLRECCPTVLHLSKYLGEFISEAARQRLADDHFDEWCEYLIKETYCQGFQCIALSHLFNFDSEEEVLDLDDFSIGRVNFAKIPPLLGEKSDYSFR